MLASIVLSMVVGAVPAAKSTSWIPLVKVGPSFDDTWKSSLVAASELQLNTKKRTKMVQPPETSIDNTMVAMGCVKWGPECAHQIGEALGAERKLMVNVAAEGEGATIAFKLVDRKGKVVQKSGPYRLPDRAKEGRGRALKAVRAFIYGKFPTELVVKPTPSNATVRINKRKQRKRKSKVTVNGRYDVDVPITVVVSARGYETQTQVIKLEAGLTTTLDIALKKPAPIVQPTDDPTGPTVAVAPKDAPPPDEVTPDENPRTKAGSHSKGIDPDGPVALTDDAPDDGSEDGPDDGSATGGNETADDSPVGDGITDGGSDDGVRIAPALFWGGVGSLSFAGVGAAAAVAPWAYSALYAFIEPKCTTTIGVEGIEARCPTEVTESAVGKFGEVSHLFPWVGVPGAALLGAAGAGLLISGIVLGGNAPLDEDSEVPSSPTSAGLHPLAPLR